MLGDLISDQYTVAIFIVKSYYSVWRSSLNMCIATWHFSALDVYIAMKSPHNLELYVPSQELTA